MQLRLLLRSVLLLGIGSVLHVIPCAADDVVARDSSTPETSSTPAVGTTQEPTSLLRSISTSFDGTVASRYLFQGIDYSDGRSVFQPNLVMSHSNWAATVWANYQPNLGDINEVDLSLKYNLSAGKLTASPGYTYLRYPNRDWAPSQELFTDFAFDAPLHPSLSVHHDFDAGDGTYATLGLSQALGSELTLGSNVFYQHRYYGMTGIPSVELKAGASFPYGSLNLMPTVSYFATTDNRTFSGDLRIPSGWLLSLNVASK